MSDSSFPKRLRLLSPSDYQPVFKQARYKVSCQHLLVLATNSNLSHPRLGLVIAKKNIATAVQRNRTKRLIRESFRLRQDLLPALDIVILARHGLGTLDNALIQKKLEKLWQDLTQKTKHKPGKQAQ